MSITSNVVAGCGAKRNISHVVAIGLLAMVLIGVTGCGPSPEEQRQLIDECKKQGLSAQVMINGFNGSVEDVYCYPKFDKDGNVK